MASRSVQDLWYIIDRKTGEKRPSARYGQGKRWRARYRDESDKEHARHFDRRTDAQRWLDEVTAMQVTGVWVDPKHGKATFKQWFNAWTERQIWSPNTLNIAEQSIGCVTFGDVPIGKVRTAQVQQWVRDLSAPKPQGKGLAPRTVRSRFGFVRQCFKAAVRERVVPFDPTDNVTLPRVPRREESMAMPSPDELGRIIDAAEPHFRAFIRVGAFAGLRLAEVSGLQVSDVDFLRGTISVARQVQGTTAHPRVELPKAGSARTLLVPRALTDAIAEHLAEFGSLGDERWIFHHERRPLLRNRVSDMWRRATVAAGAPAYVFHSTRHFHASALIHAGCDVVSVQRALGHSTPGITLATYSHLFASGEERTRAAAENLIQLTESATADSVRTRREERSLDQA